MASMASVTAFVTSKVLFSRTLLFTSLKVAPVNGVRSPLTASLCPSSPAAISNRFGTTTCLFDVVKVAGRRKDRLYSEIEVELRAHQPEVLKSYTWFASTAAKELDIPVLESWAEPEPYMLRKTLLKSKFAHGKHRVQYEMRTHYHYFKVGRLTESTALTYLEYIQRNLPEGVSMKVTKHQRLQTFPGGIVAEKASPRPDGQEAFLPPSP